MAAKGGYYRSALHNPCLAAWLFVVALIIGILSLAIVYTLLSFQNVIGDP